MPGKGIVTGTRGSHDLAGRFEHQGDARDD